MSSCYFEHIFLTPSIAIFCGGFAGVGRTSPSGRGSRSFHPGSARPAPACLPTPDPCRRKRRPSCALLRCWKISPLSCCASCPGNRPGGPVARSRGRSPAAADTYAPSTPKRGWDPWERCTVCFVWMLTIWARCLQEPHSCPDWAGSFGKIVKHLTRSWYE